MHTAFLPLSLLSPCDHPNLKDWDEGLEDDTDRTTVLT